MELQQFSLNRFFRQVIGLSLVFVFAYGTVNAQEETKREIKKERKEFEKQERINAVKALIDSKTFVFKADMALPTGMRSINLVSNPNSLEFTPESITSDMPFFGRAFSNVSYGGNGGMQFKGLPKSYEIENIKDKYEVYAEVNDANDHYRIYLTIGSEGNATLNILSNNRSPMTYYGEISEVLNIEKNNV
ncbi:DUF4251 domain-containing protein [Gaetbulibacter saemankumensis]|uniref:DUF4251 domain-containing protein n=1 Tax=Gaetbulibacter saemankumensis TaxID=311208 RepID=UPI0003FE1F58|nr:DUF4251 domain-containing protein [Gaetbulibacter saemankumensis]